MKLLKFVLLSVLIVLGLAMAYGISPMRPVRDVFTFTTIDAPKQKVWQVLTNFDAYRQWNPFYTQVEGKCLAGTKLRIQVQMQEHTLFYSPEIETVTPQAELAWHERLILPGLFDGEHRFELESNDAGQTRFVQHDRYSGTLVPLLMNLYQAEAETGFRRMNDALKKRAEQESALDAQQR
jgi:hypothetical protein